MRNPALEQLSDLIEERDVMQRRRLLMNWMRMWVERATTQELLDTEYLALMRDRPGFEKFLAGKEGATLGSLIVKEPGVSLRETETVDENGSPAPTITARYGPYVRRFEQRRRSIILLRWEPKQ